ncbi:hypothetical protein [Marisediminicola senii]|uniref:hypothetical protein n=1 Tax=Marisediminicola senii TaxID=2711233 RepID=UPI0013EDDC07|nr:hypothetical protein [Marisediminicola senii]
MIEYGGTLCSVGFAHTDNTWRFGHSPMNDAGIAELRALLTSRGYQSTPSADGDVFCVSYDLGDDCFLLGGSGVFWSTDASVLPDLVAALRNS